MHAVTPGYPWSVCASRIFALRAKTPGYPWSVCASRNTILSVASFLRVFCTFFFKKRAKTCLSKAGCKNHQKTVFKKLPFLTRTAIFASFRVSTATNRLYEDPLKNYAGLNTLEKKALFGTPC